MLFVIYILSMKTPWFDHLWVWILPHPAAVICQVAAVWGPLVAVLIGLARHLTEWRNRRAVYIIAVLVGLWGVYTVARQLVNPGASADSRWQGEVMIQSTESTCIAAASCTYLRTLGVLLSEKEAAQLGLINDQGGTMSNAWRILALAMPEARVRLGRLDRERVAGHGGWLLSSIQVSTFIGHAVVIRDNGDGETLTVRDPLEGEYVGEWEDFSDGWLSYCAWVE